MTMLRRFTWSVSVLVVLAAALRSEPGDEHMALGNPSKAEADPAKPDPENYLMKKAQYVLSYNSKRGTPNWVSWRLLSKNLGKTKAKPFHPDPDLPKEFYHVKRDDYHFPETGMTRGHQCPRADRNDTDENCRATYAMTNMVPQPPELNGGIWGDLEDYCRKLVKEGKELYIICGPAGKGGRSSKGFFVFTDPAKKVTVPGKCWKVIAVLEPGEMEPAQRVSEDTRLIAVIMPNDVVPKGKKWKDYRVRV